MDMSDPDGQSNSRLPLWPFFYCVLPILVGLVLVVLINQPDSAPKDDISTAIPSLGGQSRPLTGPPETDTPAEDTTETEPEDEAPEPEPQDDTPQAREYTTHEMDALVSRLVHAARVGDRRGLQMVHAELRTAAPSELVDKTLVNERAKARYARVRIELFRALHEPEARLEWVMDAWRTRTPEFTGRAELTEAGEQAELIEYARHLLQHHPYDDPTPELIRGTLDTRKPEWLLELLVSELHLVAEDPDDRARLRPIWEDIDRFLKSGGLKGREEGVALLDTWALYHDPHKSALEALRAPQLAHVLPAFLLLDWWPRGILDAEGEAELARLVRDTLAARHDPALKAGIIRALGRGTALEDVRKVILEGLDRRDENLGDYLVALGRLARGESDLARLAELARAGDANTARGAIEGLRVCRLPGADALLTELAEQGANPGVQSQALGALLSRARDPERLLDQYLDPNRDAALRAVAVAHVTSDARLQRVVQEDTSLRVRQAALTRLGERKDVRMLSFFTRVRDRDPSPVIRQQARQYAEELRQIEAETGR
jgi:hypothetical protein